VFRRGDDELAVTVLEIEELLDLAAGFLDQVETGDAHVGGAELDELGMSAARAKRTWYFPRWWWR